MAKIKLTPLSEIVDETWGVIGTPERDRMEAQLKEDLHAYHVGEAIRQARKNRHLTQAQLGDLMGVQRAQVSRIERGHNLTVGTIVRAFNALGVSASLRFGDTSISLC